MRFLLRRTTAVAATGCAVAVLSAAVVTGLAGVLAGGRGGDDVPGGGSDGHAEVRLGGRSFRISGDALRPLSPGRSAAIDVVFSNPRDARLHVTSLRVRVRAVSAPNATSVRPCTRRDFAVRQVRPHFAAHVPARSTRRLSESGLRRGAWPRVRMVNRPVNQDGCKGASITLGFRGSGSFRQ